MKKWILAAAVIVVLGLFTVDAPAQGTTPSTGTPSVQTTPTSRSGLVRRFQERRGRVAMTNPASTTSDSSVVPASGTSRVEANPMTPSTTTTPTTPSVEPRTGLFSRLRARR